MFQRIIISGNGIPKRIETLGTESTDANVRMKDWWKGMPTKKPLPASQTANFFYFQGNKSNEKILFFSLEKTHTFKGKTNLKSKRSKVASRQRTELFSTKPFSIQKRKVSQPTEFKWERQWTNNCVRKQNESKLKFPLNIGKRKFFFCFRIKKIGFN